MRPGCPISVRCLYCCKLPQGPRHFSRTAFEMRRPRRRQQTSAVSIFLYKTQIRCLWASGRVTDSMPHHHHRLKQSQSILDAHTALEELLPRRVV